MKHFMISAHIDGFFVFEDPKCPSYWRGSGVYNIEVKSWFEVICDVWAETEEEAMEMVEGYDYDSDAANPICMTSDVVEVKGVEFLGDAEGEKGIDVRYTASDKEYVSDEELREAALEEKEERMRGN